MIEIEFNYSNKHYLKIESNIFCFFLFFQRESESRDIYRYDDVNCILEYRDICSQ